MTVRARHLLPFFLFPFSFFLSQGCASGPATLTLRPQGQEVFFAKTFDQAYCGKDRDGYACVLVSEDKPADGDVLRQVVHIKVLWRPLTGTREASASNATIDWYVMSNTPESDGLLVYQGAGTVTFEPDGQIAKVTVRSADLRPVISRGNLKDPIGNANITGAFTATAAPKRMHELLSITRQRMATVASGR